MSAVETNDDYYGPMIAPAGQIKSISKKQFRNNIISLDQKSAAARNAQSEGLNSFNGDANSRSSLGGQNSSTHDLKLQIPQHE